MCVTSIARVRGVIASRNRSTTYASERGGTSKAILLTTIPSRRARWSHAVSMRG